MEFRPIFLSIKHNKAIALLVIIQVAITLTVLSGSLLMTTTTLKEWNLPSGIPHHNIISAVPQFYDLDADVRQSVVDDLQRLKAIPGVIDVSPVSQRPFDARGIQKNLLGSNRRSPRIRHQHFLAVTLAFFRYWHYRLSKAEVLGPMT